MVRLMTDTWTPGPLRLPKGWQPVAQSWRQVKGKGKGIVKSERELEEGEELEDRGSPLSETPSERAHMLAQAADASPIRIIHAASEPRQEAKSGRDKTNQKRSRKRRSSRSRRRSKRRKEEKEEEKTIEEEDLFMQHWVSMSDEEKRQWFMEKAAREK